MNFKFLKSLLACSAFAMGSIALTACGGDSSSSADEGDGTSSAQEVILSSASETSPLNSASSVEGKVLPDGNNGWELTLTGTLQIDNFFTPEGADDMEYSFAFDSLSFIIGKIGDDGKEYVADSSLRVVPKREFPANNVNMAGAYEKIPLNQDKIGCGKFKMHVWAYMSEIEEHAFPSTALLSFDFDVPCKTVESSSSEAPKTCTELVRAEATLQNLVSSDINYLNLEGGTEPQLTMSIENGNTYYLQAAPGIEIWEEIGDLTGGVDPEDPVCMEDLNVMKETNTDKKALGMSTEWYIVTTPGGNKYLFRVGEKQSDGNSSGLITLVYYKKK